MTRDTSAKLILHPYTCSKTGQYILQDTRRLTAIPNFIIIVSESRRTGCGLAWGATRSTCHLFWVSIRRLDHRFSVRDSTHRRFIIRDRFSCQTPDFDPSREHLLPKTMERRLFGGYMQNRCVRNCFERKICRFVLWKYEWTIVHQISRFWLKQKSAGLSSAVQRWSTICKTRNLAYFEPFLGYKIARGEQLSIGSVSWHAWGYRV